MKVDEPRLLAITRLANEMKRLDKIIKDIEAELKVFQDQYNQISAVDLPEIMSEIGMKHFALTDGTAFTVKPVLDVRVREGEIETADKWLTINGHDGMIKMQIQLPRGVTNQSLNSILNFIRQQGILPDYKKTINWQTLQKWGREMENEGMVIPETIFNVFRSNKTVIGD